LRGTEYGGISVILGRFEESRVKTGIFGKIRGSFGKNVGVLREFSGESDGNSGEFGKMRGNSENVGEIGGNLGEFGKIPRM